MPSWTQTKLWELLSSRGGGAERTRHYVRSWLIDVELLLAKGGSTPLDFTLHDDDHSYRVSERMYDLIPDETLARLSDYEIALLLQSAYLHDIGMNPRREVVKKIRDYLYSADDSSLVSSERTNLQRWLDENYPGVQPPISSNAPQVERLQRAELLTGLFCRHRHNDWSGQYIEEKAVSVGDAPYPMWTQDLIALCKSHHYGLHALLEDQFNLRIVGSDNSLVNLRYLAAILRLSDVLDFDPERTPDVIFLHRSIAPRSRIFWHKDHDISLGINGQTAKILVTARTGDAWTHRAVIQTADDVDHELQICAAINDQKGFIRGVRLDGPDYYEWPWPRSAARDISPRPHTFTYIDGAFRPDPQRILSLLAGTELYSSPLVALRELLQNAFDAVKEQIAISLLQESDPNDLEIQRAHSRIHRVSISLEEADGVTWLTCADSGVGMTRKVIEEYLLVSGSRPRPEILELQRRCIDRGLPFQRVGQFGIGVLSYFMLADKMIIETRAHSESLRGAELHGWRFETEGIDAFGELRPEERPQRGTTVKLRIRSDQQDLVASSAVGYLSKLLAKVPCTLELNFGQKIIYSEGWVRKEEDLLDSVVPKFGGYRLADESEKLMSDYRRSENKKKLEKLRETKERAKRCLRLHGPREAALPNGLGSVRVHLPYFMLNDRASLYYLDFDNSCVTLNPDNKAIAQARPSNYQSWRGFQVEGFSLRRGGWLESQLGVFSHPAAFVVEVDLVEGASISVNRESLDVANSKEINEFIQDLCAELFEDFIASRSESPYASLTQEWDKAAGGSAHWLFPSENGGENELLVWRPIKFPAVLIPKETGKYEQRLDLERLDSMGFQDELRPLEIEYDRRWPLPNTEADRLVFRDYHFPCLVFENLNRSKSDERRLVEFPPEWEEVLAVTTDHLEILNKSHKLSRVVSPEIWREFNACSHGVRDGDFLGFLRSADPKLSAAWLISKAGEPGEVWDALRDNFTADFEGCFERAGFSRGQSFLVWKSQYQRGVRKISMDGCDFNEGEKELPSIEGKEWYLTSPSRRAV